MTRKSSTIYLTKEELREMFDVPPDKIIAAPDNALSFSPVDQMWRLSVETYDNEDEIDAP